MAISAIIPYLILLILLLLIISVEQHFTNKFLRLLPFLIMAVFSGFRFNVGQDYEAYEKLFYLVSNNIGNEEEFLEIGYVFLIKAVDAINGTQQLIFLIFATLTCLLIYKYIENHSPNFAASTLIYLTIGTFFLSSFNGMRQALVIALFAFSLKYILKRSFWKYLILILLGALFHKTALFMLPLYWVLTVSLTLKKMAAILTLVLITTETGILSYLVEQTGYSVYLSEQTGSDIEWSILIFFFIAIIVIAIGKDLSFTKEENIFYNLNFLSLATVFASLFSNHLSTDMFLRINNYFMIGYIILIPFILNRGKEKAMLYYVMIIFSIAYYFLTIFTEGKMLPYEMNFDLFQAYR